MALKVFFRPLSILLLLIVAFPLFSFYQNKIQPSGYTIKANIIYHFTKYIDWPGTRKSGDFIIGIVGESPLLQELRKIAGDKKVGNQQIVIKQLPAYADNYDCHILFIPQNESGSLKRIVAKTMRRAILLVSESNSLASKGSCINFKIVEEHVKLEINKNNLEERSLRIANELVKLATLVK